MSSKMVEIHPNKAARENIGALETQLSIPTTTKPIRWLLLLPYCTCFAVGNIGGPMLQRLYFMHGGNRQWLSSWVQSIGFLFMVAPLTFLYLKKSTSSKTAFLMEPKLFVSSSVLGVMIGFANYMYSLGLSFIPVSTSSLLISTQVAFTASFAFIIVKQRFTFYSFNSVVLMTLGAAVLALHASGDRPAGVSQGKYLFGFFILLAAAALMGLVMPLNEMAYRKSSKPISNITVMQFQFVMNLAATIVATVGMLINTDFQKIPVEARNYGLGVQNYYVVLVASAIMWQISSLGVTGVINCSSSLFAGILSAVTLPITEVAAVIVYHEKFTAEKAMALVLCLWGFTSYFIGEYKQVHKHESIEHKSSEVHP